MKKTNVQPRIRVSKTTVTSCVFCNLENTIRDNVSAMLATARELYPEKNVRSSWDIIENDVIGVPGYTVSFFRPEKDDDWGSRRENGLYRESDVPVCNSCASVFFKCLDNIGEAEEIGYCKKDTSKEVKYPPVDTCYETEEEQQ